MGLVKLGKEALNNIGFSITSTLEDQYRKSIHCEDMGNSILMKRVTPKNATIAATSIIIVGPGQVAVIYDNGKIIDATAEEGYYRYDDSTAPSFFAGQFGEAFKEMWERFSFGGERYRTQCVYYFNMKEIIDNKFGTSTPIPFRNFEHAVMNARTNSLIPMRVNIKCFGKYTFQLSDPALFMNRLAGTKEVYTKDEINEQIRSEVLAAFTNVINGFGSDENRVGALSLPSKTLELKRLMEEKVFDDAIRERGLKIVSFIVESVTLDDESVKKIDQYELGGDVYNQKAVLVESYANAIEGAANNASGATTGFMGMGMMNMSTGNVVQPVAAAALAADMPTEPQTYANVATPTNTESTATNKETTTCQNCGNEDTGKFCSECGSELPQQKFCTNCGKEVSGKFCSDCGTPTDKKTPDATTPTAPETATEAPDTPTDNEA